MSYCIKNFRTKKDLKAALSRGEIIKCFQPGLGPDLSSFTGTVYLEGPWYPEPHKWYAAGRMENGILKSIK